MENVLRIVTLYPILLTRRVHTLWKTDFTGALKVDFWYLKMKPSEQTDYKRRKKKLQFKL